jgi:hypothetical protein
MTQFGTKEKDRVTKADIHELMIRSTLHKLLGGSMALKESPFRNTAVLEALYDMEKHCDCDTPKCVGDVGPGKRLIINDSTWLR